MHVPNILLLLLMVATAASAETVDHLPVARFTGARTTGHVQYAVRVTTPVEEGAKPPIQYYCRVFFSSLPNLCAMVGSRVRLAPSSIVA